jgi:hypothetical protein
VGELAVYGALAFVALQWMRSARRAARARSRAGGPVELREAMARAWVSRKHYASEDE